ncbi:MAG: helicase SNF2, partial [Eubacteriales bacterium]
EKSKILEPAMGVGNFLGAMPDFFAQAKVSGTELDSISGRIAKQLYPQAKIEIGSFEHTKHRNNSFDIAIGNVPFGDTKLFEPTMARNMNIHDFFFGKSLDKVKTGGIVAFITSSGTMDKRNSDIRKYLSERADLLGAIRLPNTAFKSNAGTEVTADIIFLQKREAPPKEYPDWVTVKENVMENGDKITMNQYFIDHPDMIMGQMKLTPSQYGPAPTCMPDKSTTLKEQLSLAVVKLEKPDLALLKKQIAKEEEARIIPETPENARNFSFIVIDNELYFNRNGELEHKPMKESEQERVMALVELVDQTRNVIDLQVNNCTDFKLLEAQEKLNLLHDNFYEKYGVFAEKENKKAFEDDTSYPLLRSLQNLDSEGNLQSKADIFFQRTIKQTTKITSVDTPAEALVVSISEKACVDIPFMAELMGGEHKAQEVIDGLKGVIFKEPTSDMNSPHTGWKTADEYLSGNVRKKLETAKEMAKIHPELEFNVEMLEKVQPKPLEAGEISVRLGATWIPQEVYTEFMHHLFDPSERVKRNTAVEFSPDTGDFGIKGKNLDKSSTLASSVYGSKRRSGYEILEKTLNLKDVKVFDTKEVDGKKVQVYNKKESEIAEECQKKIQGAFEDWIWESPERRESLSKLYNETFNSIRPREFDGSHIKFDGMTDKIELNPHQKNAVARTLYGGNTMLAHCVGAGKTFTMIASAMEGKRLGLHNKSLIIVPNHLTSQVGADVYKLYPNAKVLVAGSDDFSKDKRREVCSRIATGNYDIVVLGHTQFEKIPLSPERIEKTIRQQVAEITKAIKSAKQSDGESFTVKNLEKKKRELEG